MRLLTTVLVLVLAQTAGATSILSTQSVACLDGTAPGQCSGLSGGTLTNGGDTMTWAGDVATAGFGLLHVATDMTNFSVTNGTALSYGFVSFQDMLTISDPSKTGQTGNLTVSYYIDGSVGHSGSGSGFLQVVTRVCTPLCTSPVPAADNYVADFNSVGASSSYNESLVVPKTFSFTYGTQFEMYFSMQATAGSINDSGPGGGYSNLPVTGSGSGFANFANTLQLNGLQTGDANATFSSDSGTVYTADGVPEPATLLLCGAPLVLLFSRRRK